METHTTLSGVGARPMRPLRPRRVAPGSEPAPVAGGGAFWAAVLGPALPADVVAELQELAQVRELPAGSLLVSSREPARDLCLIARGDVALGSARRLTAASSPSAACRARLDASSAHWAPRPRSDAVVVSDVTLVMPRADVQVPMSQTGASSGGDAGARQCSVAHGTTHDLMHMTPRALRRTVAAALLQRSGERSAASRCRSPSASATSFAARDHARDAVARDAQPQPPGVISVAGYTVKVADVDALRKVAEGLRALAGVRARRGCSPRAAAPPPTPRSPPALLPRPARRSGR